MAKVTFANKLAWNEIDVDTLDTGDRNAYDAYKAAYKTMKALRVQFEDEMQLNAPEGKRLVFGYNFGKLSVALDDAKDAPKAKQGKQSLADFLDGSADRQH